MNFRTTQRILADFCFNNRGSLTNLNRSYSRWTHRRPSKVILSYEDDNSLKEEKVIDLKSNYKKPEKKDITKDVKNISIKTKYTVKAPIRSLVENNIKKDYEIIEENNNNEKLSNNIKVNSSERKSFNIESNNKKNADIKQNIFDKTFKSKEIIVLDENNDVIYEKLGDNDGRISNLLIKLKSKKDRVKAGHILVEGWRLIVDGLEAKCKLKYLIFSNVEDLHNLRPFLPKTGVKVYKIPYKEIQLWSAVETSSGILGVFEMPSPENISESRKALPINIICDNIRVPGNLGAVLRAAVGVGCDQVVLMKGCVDLWEPKVIRSAAGAHFRLPIHHSVEWDQLNKFIENESSVFIADNNIDVAADEIEAMENSPIPVVPYYSIEYSTLQSMTLIVGGETEGISEECFRYAINNKGLRLNIPMENGVDSLNTGMATAVIIFEMKKQLMQAMARHTHEKKSESF